jgi:PAS domain S-box-containing protein
VILIPTYISLTTMPTSTIELLREELAICRKINRLILEKQDAIAFLQGVCVAFYESGRYSSVWIEAENSAHRIMGDVQESGSPIIMIAHAGEAAPLSNTLITIPLSIFSDVKGAFVLDPKDPELVHQIGELKTELELALEKINTENDFEMIIHDSPDGVVMFNSHLKIVQMNDRFCTIFNQPKAIFKDQYFVTLAEKFFEGDVLADIRAVGMQLEDGLNTQLFFDLHYISRFYTVHVLSRRTSRNIFMIFKDVTDFKKAMIDVKTSENRYRLLSKLTFEGVFVHHHGQLIDWNESFLTLIGCSEEEVMSINLIDMVANERDKELVRENIARRYNYPYTIEIKRHDGSTFIAELEAKNIVYNEEERRLVAIRDITARFELQQQLHEYARKMETLMDNLPGLVFTCNNNSEWEMLFLSAGCKDLLGYLPSELINNTIVGYNNLIHPDDREYVWTTIQEATSKGVPFQLDYRIVTKSGMQKWVSERGKEVSKGVLEGFISDITDAKEMELKLLETNELLLKAQRLGKMGSWLLKLNTGMVIASEQACAIYGIEHEEDFTFDRLKHIPLTEYRPLLEKAMSNLINGEAEYDVEFKIMNRKSLEVLDIHSVATYNKETNEVSGVIQDISAQKLAREELTNSVANFSHIFNVTHDTICILSLVGRIIDVNQTFIDRMEYSLDELLYEKINIIDPEATNEVISRLVNELQQMNGVQIFESVHFTKSGRRIPVEVYSKMIEYNGKQSILSISRDITERKQAEMEIRTHQHYLERLVKLRTEALEASNKEMEAFTYSVSHDLRAPLRTISGFAEYLEQDYSSILDQEGIRYIRVIADSAVKMDELIVNLLRLSRASRIEPEFIELNMNALARSMYMEVATSLEQQEFKLIVHDLPDCKGDLTSIKQVWSNLISNALKYSAKSARKRIEIGCSEQTGSFVIYYVKDEGVGFNMEYKHKLFEVFQRLHKETDYKGTGVGLAIVKRIIEKHNGDVWAESSSGNGTVFYFKLPLIT